MTDWNEQWERFRDKGGLWVVAQFILLALIVAVPMWASRPVATLPVPLHAAGWLLLALGLVCVVLAAQALGSALTPLPRPVSDGTLRIKGIYGVVRHPMYLGVLCLALGWVLLRQSAPGMLLVAVLFVFLDRKAAREEQWLIHKYPDYANYQTRVKKLLPGIY
jgi:protein-S-isoprenylcysteine O-methyltransferase Ste14